MLKCVLVKSLYPVDTRGHLCFQRTRFSVPASATGPAPRPRAPGTHRAQSASEMLRGRRFRRARTASESGETARRAAAPGAATGLAVLLTSGYPPIPSANSRCMVRIPRDAFFYSSLRSAPVRAVITALSTASERCCQLRSITRAWLRLGAISSMRISCPTALCCVMTTS